MDYQPIAGGSDDSRTAHVTRRGILVLSLGALASVVFFFALRPQPSMKAKSSAFNGPFLDIDMTNREGSLPPITWRSVYLVSRLPPPPVLTFPKSMYYGRGDDSIRVIRSFGLPVESARFPTLMRTMPVMATDRSPAVESDPSSLFDRVCTSSANACVGEIPKNSRLFFVRRECNSGLVADRCICAGVNGSALVLINRQDRNVCSCLFQAMHASSHWTMQPNCH